MKNDSTHKIDKTLYEQAYEEGKEQSKKAATKLFQKQLKDQEETVKKLVDEAVKNTHDKQTSKSFFEKTNSFGPFKMAGEMLGKISGTIGKLPLGYSEIHPYEYHLLKLADYRKFPAAVAGRFVLLYIVPPLTIRFIAKGVSSFFSEIKDRRAQGESVQQKISRLHVQKSCDDLNNLTKNNLLPLEKFSTEKLHEIKQKQDKCSTANQFYNSMKNTMALRRKTGIGDQTFYGEYQNTREGGVTYQLDEHINQFNTSLLIHSSKINPSTLFADSPERTKLLQEIKGNDSTEVAGLSLR